MAMFLNRSRQVPAEDTPAFGGVAERFRRAGDLDRAIALCREGLKKFPTLLSARVTLGWALLDKGMYDEARVELEQVLRRAPDNLAAIRGLAELHDRAENHVPSMEHGAEWHEGGSEFAGEVEALASQLSGQGESMAAAGQSTADEAAEPASPVIPAALAQNAAPAAAPTAGAAHGVSTEPPATFAATPPVDRMAPQANAEPVRAVSPSVEIPAARRSEQVPAAGRSEQVPVARTSEPIPAQPGTPFSAVAQAGATQPAAPPAPAASAIVFTNSAGVELPSVQAHVAGAAELIAGPVAPASASSVPATGDSSMASAPPPVAEFEPFEVGPPAVYEFTNSAGAPFVPAAPAGDASEAGSGTPRVLDAGELPVLDAGELPAAAFEAVAGASAELTGPELPEVAVAGPAFAHSDVRDAAELVAPNLESVMASEPIELVAVPQVSLDPSPATIGALDEFDPELPPAAPVLLDSGVARPLHEVGLDQAPQAGPDDVVALPAAGEVVLEELASVFAPEPEPAASPTTDTAEAPEAAALIDLVAPPPGTSIDLTAMQILAPMDLAEPSVRTSLDLATPQAFTPVEFDEPQALTPIDFTQPQAFAPIDVAEPRTSLEAPADVAARQATESDALLDLLAADAIPPATAPPADALPAVPDGFTSAAFAEPAVPVVESVQASAGAAEPQVVPITHVSRRAAQIAALEKFLRQVEARRLQLAAGSVA